LFAPSAAARNVFDDFSKAPTFTSLVNPQQVSAKVTHEAQALRDLEACGDFALDSLIALVWPLAQFGSVGWSLIYS
jgi:hypothetical protein